MQPSGSGNVTFLRDSCCQQPKFHFTIACTVDSIQYSRQARQRNYLDEVTMVFSSTRITVDIVLSSDLCDYDSSLALTELPTRYH
jgi:hypothetical protein